MKLGCRRHSTPPRGSTLKVRTSLWQERAARSSPSRTFRDRRIIPLRSTGMTQVALIRDHQKRSEVVQRLTFGQLPQDPPPLLLNIGVAPLKVKYCTLRIEAPDIMIKNDQLARAGFLHAYVTGICPNQTQQLFGLVSIAGN